MLLVILNDATFFCQIREDLKKDLTIGIQGQLRSRQQDYEFSNDHVKFTFQDGLFYCDGFFYVHDGLTQLQVLQIRHDVLAASHFRFKKTMELMFRNYWWPQLWRYVKEFVGILQCLCLSKKICVIALMISFNHYQSLILVVFNFHGFHHKPSTF